MKLSRRTEFVLPDVAGEGVAVGLLVDVAVGVLGGLNLLSAATLDVVVVNNNRAKEAIISRFVFTFLLSLIYNFLPELYDYFLIPGESLGWRCPRQRGNGDRCRFGCPGPSQTRKPR